MHVPDGFLDLPTSVGTGAVAVVGVGLALRGARRELSEAAAPLAGLVAVFVFAAQMLNFPVGAGTSGHLLGGALAAILVGPYTATLALTVVLLGRLVWRMGSGALATGDGAAGYQASPLTFGIAAALVQAGAIDGLSIGYRTVRAERDRQGRRVLTEVELWEVSLVTFPMLAEAKVGRKSDGALELAAAFRAAAQALRAE
mgnify:CR=1 FL=1